MANPEYDEEEELDLDSIEDEQTLIELLDEAEDFDERKRIRDRLMKVQHEIKAQREKDRRRREEDREQAIRNKVKEADMKKKKTLEMYSEMAKGGTPAGRKGSLSGPQDSTGKPKDLVEEAIKDRLQAADNRKKRILAAYDHAAKSQPAGQARIVEFDAFRSADVSKLEPPKPVKGSCCFSMAGGVPKVEKIVPASVRKPRMPVDESELDPMERAIRARVREAEERKKRTLAAYDMAARTGGAGPKVVILQEFRDLKIDEEPRKPPRYDPCFRGGLKT
ncbi:uncharacterized protein [Parasteatoda tepidariorum]|uniref:uncharacterized protein isoform X1 n=1 Tax=Parasteatoda tepidariorum TaxID=114398 RepID=UPI001C72095D|nr:uncharacterized protein LOC107451611 isoform X1 [Parasteatoda tepidariorum]XP_042905810.1 uncharacterized protein LOC107451611 isoform X2 [Parasteatoda tepidariorum]